jgi:hypothetical protein
LNRRPAVIVDMDGTLCDVSAVAHLQAEADGFAAFHQACAACPPHAAVVNWCMDFYRQGHEILVVTGRDAWAHTLTDQWLLEHLPVRPAAIYMRGAGDLRSNIDVKREIRSQLLAEYDIRAAIDDDPEIVELWSEAGIAVALVLDGGDVVPLAGSLRA